MASARIHVGGITLHHRDVGTGPACVVLHGFTGSHRSVGDLVDAIATDRRVLAPDLVGHGESDAPADVRQYSMAAIVDHLDHLLAETQAAPAALVGYSFGARVALSYAVARPQAVTSVVTIGGTPGLSEPAEAAARRRADGELADRIERDGIPAFVDHWERAPIFATQAGLPPDVRADIRAGRLANRAVGLANSLRGAGTGSMPPLWDDLTGLAVPTTVVAGALDEKFVEIGRRMVVRLPVGRLELVPDAGHAAHLEAPERCIEVVRRALAGVPDR